jgi:hypothetical protein
MVDTKKVEMKMNNLTTILAEMKERCEAARAYKFGRADANDAYYRDVNQLLACLEKAIEQRDAAYAMFRTSAFLNPNEVIIELDNEKLTKILQAVEGKT